MKRTRTMCLALLLAMAVGAWGQDSAPSEAPAPDEAPALESGPWIVARVDNEVITRDEFNNAVKALRARLRKPEITLEEQITLINRMIESRVVYLLAKEAKTEVTDEEVQEAIDQAKKQMASEEAYQNFLRAQGMTEEGLRESLRRQLLTRKFIQAKTSEIVVTDERMAQEYERLKEDGRMDIADFAHILVLVRGHEQEAAAAKKKIEAARERIIAGADFGEVAGEVSEDTKSASRGGAYLRVTRGMMEPGIEKRIFEDPIGEISEPFRTRLGWHIMTVTGRGVLTLDEVSDTLRATLRAGEGMKVMKDVVEQAKKGMNIQIMLTTGGGSQEQDVTPTGDVPLPSEAT